jgi:hypothetical protein
MTLIIECIAWLNFIEFMENPNNNGDNNNLIESLPLTS